MNPLSSRSNPDSPEPIHVLQRFDAVRWSGSLAVRMRKLTEWFANRGSILVAFSGGVDSTFLAAVAFQVLGERALAVTADSPSLPRAELDEACELARLIGIAHGIVVTEEMANPSFAANPPDRCYYCKSELFDTLVAMAAERGFSGVADGSNVEDLGDFRPGSKAACERGVVRPLQDFGFSKADIRRASRNLGLPTADKPAAACLASRLPYGTSITPEALARIEASEAVLLKLGFRHCRVRVHGEVARVELPSRDLARALRHREAILSGLSAAGNRYITLDLRGYRTGSMNEVLSAGT